MIGSLKIQNFQSHKDSELIFSPGVNAIVGLSDTGKTAILRALRWLIENRPAGEAMRSDWGGEISVEAILQNGQKRNMEILGVERYRNGKENAYRLNHDTFKAIKSEVPEEIQQALNITKVNLQHQHDTAFLLTSSPGEVAQHFNQVANIESIDRGMKKVQSAFRKHEQNLKTGTENLEVLNRDLANFDYLEAYEKKVVALEELERGLTQFESSIVKLKKLIQEIRETESKIDEYQKLTRLSGPVNAVLQLYKHLTAEHKNISNLQNLIQDIRNTTTGMKMKKSSLKKLQTQFKESFPDVCPLCEQEVKR